MRTRVAVIGGGQNCEHDVSLASAASVAGALDPAAYDVVPLTIGRDGTWRDRGLRPIGLCGAAQVLRGCDVVFPVVHGPRGEDGALAALCELAGVPYVGSGVRRRRARDGQVGDQAGRRGASASPPRPVHLRHRGHGRAPALDPPGRGQAGRRRLEPRRQPGRPSPTALRPALDAALALDDRVLVEDVVVGREIDVAVLRRADGSAVVAPALEIVADGLFDTTPKYGGHADFRVPAALDEVDAKALEDAALAAYDALGCAGVARVDFFLTEDGPVLNEVNTMPGMTEHSQVPRMFAAAGLVVPGAARRARPRRRTADRRADAWFHCAGW